MPATFGSKRRATPTPLSRAVAHAATKRELVAKQRPPGWTPPSMLRLPEVLTEAEVVEAEAESKALRRRG